MTRCFGDIIARNIGVISVPDIKFFDIKNEDKYIIIASDGIWDVLT